MSNHTMFPKTLQLLREDGTTPQEIKVGQITLKNYDAALKAVNSENEFALCAIACGVTEALIKSLSPESFESVLGEVFLINEKGFFTYARRRKSSSAERAMIREMAEQMVNLQSRAPILAPSSPVSPPRPA
jgi:hypothetical protein